MYVKLIDLMTGISGALDLLSPEVVGHHKRTAELAATLAHAMDLPDRDITDIFIAGLLHDIGAFSRRSRLDALDFETKDVHHAELGYRLLHPVPHLGRAARVIRLHHTPWQKITHEEDALLANVLNLADRIDVSSIDHGLLARLQSLSGTLFAPEALKALTPDVLHLSDKLDHGGGGWWRRRLKDSIIPRSELVGFADAFAHVIDFRSRFTATHSCGVAETSAMLGKLAGMPDEDVHNLRLAGLLHDIGKLAVPSEIIEKPGVLTNEEFEVVRSHPLVCEDILGSIEGLLDTSLWACQHHERLNGRGYPHGLDYRHLSNGSRIMAVADVFTAVTEDRPYRTGMGKDEALRTLKSMSSAGFLDERHVSLMERHYEEINAARVESQKKALARFEALTA